jgi:radical SAM superfamily enzyme YgiQ (UPF0313 family)
MLARIRGARPQDALATPEGVRQAIADKLRALFPRGVQRVLLINPLPFPAAHFSAAQAKNRRYYAWPPYGIAVLRRELGSRGYQVKLVDHNYDILSFAHREADGQRIEAEVDQLWRRNTDAAIAAFQPDLVGLSCMFTMTHQMMVEVARHIRETAPGIPIMAGGVHVSNAPEFVLQSSPAIDFVGLYEGDVSFGDALDFANGKVGPESLAQLATLVDGAYLGITDRAQPKPSQINIIPDYDDLPVGEYGLLGELGSYRSWLPEGTRSSSALSVRGCRAHCSFCSVANFNGKGVRERDVHSVVDEIAHLKEKHGVTHIAWLDDDLFFNKERAMNLFNAIIERKLGITWCASNGLIASAASAAPDLVRAAAESGCIGITFGVESGSDKILREVHKPSAVKHCLKAGAMMKEYPQIFTRGFLIIGFPNETLGQIQETIDLAHKMELDWYGIQLLSPLPNTEIYKTMVELGLITDFEFKKNSEKDGSTLFVVRHGEKQRKMEEAGKHDAGTFQNPFLTRGPAHVPGREELHDLWLLVDYWINYEPILTQPDPVKLRKKRCILRDVCDRMTRNNPMANLFLGVVEYKLGDRSEATARYARATEYLDGSAYWRLRFEVLGLNELPDAGWRYGRNLEPGARAEEVIDPNLRNSGYTV